MQPRHQLTLAKQEKAWMQQLSVLLLKCSSTQCPQHKQ